MLSKAVIKYTILQFLKRYLYAAFYLSVFMIFLSFIVTYLHSGIDISTTVANFHSRFFLLNLLLILILSAGIIGGDISQGYMDLILTKPISKSSLYLSKYIATLIFGAFLIFIAVILIVGYSSLFIGKKIPIEIIVKVLVLLIIDQIIILAVSIFISTWTPREMNVLIFIFFIVLIMILPAPLKQIFSISEGTIRNILNLLIPLKSLQLNKIYMNSNGISLKHYIHLIIYFLIFFLSGAVIFKKKEIA